MNETILVIEDDINISEGLNKTTSKFVMDMQYGISKSKTCLISGIARIG